MAYANPAKFTRTNTTTKDNYDILNDDAVLLADIQAYFPYFPTEELSMSITIHYEGGVVSQAKFDSGRFNDFINGNRCDSGGYRMLRNAILSKSGTEYTVCIEFE